MTSIDRQLHLAAIPASGRAAPHISPRRWTAHRIRSDAEALEVATALAADFRNSSAVRDRNRALPLAEVERYSRSGLWGITVPKIYGGAGVSNGTLTEVIASVSAADSNLGQIPQNHFYMVEALRLGATAEQQRYYFQRVLDGDRIGNAFTEVGTRHAVDFQTRLTNDAHGELTLTGQKYYSTGALFAHLIAVVANDAAARAHVIFLERNTAGLTLVDDWSGFGQRTTGSGSTLLDEVSVTPFQVIPHQDVFDHPTPMGPIAQLIHAAVDVGIARGAFAETIEYVRAHARPWFETSYEHGYEDPHLIAALGDLAIRVNAANALLERGARYIDLAVANPTDQTVADASIAVAEAKVAATETSLLVSSKLFELAGSRSTLEEFGLDRYWRNARTHTLHDPVRWKYHHVGNFYLNDVRPPRHGAL